MEVHKVMRLQKFYVPYWSPNMVTEVIFFNKSVKMSNWLYTYDTKQYYLDEVIHEVEKRICLSFLLMIAFPWLLFHGMFISFLPNTLNLKCNMIGFWWHISKHSKVHVWWKTMIHSVSNVHVLSKTFCLLFHLIQISQWCDW